MNPWRDFDLHSGLVLPQDERAISQFNERAKDHTRLATDLLPEPFVGRLDAPVVLLALNPGLSDDDYAVHRDQSFRDRVGSCHRQDSVDWPYYYLDPAVDGPGARWSARKLGPLIREVGQRAVARGVVMFEFMAYHSRRFAHRRLALPSQEFTIASVRAALPQAAAVFIMRGAKLWKSAIPELVNHPRVFYTRSVQNVTISPRNCADGGWGAAVGALSPI